MLCLPGPSRPSWPSRWKGKDCFPFVFLCVSVRPSWRCCNSFFSLCKVFQEIISFISVSIFNMSAHLSISPSVYLTSLSINPLIYWSVSYWSSDLSSYPSVSHGIIDVFLSFLKPEFKNLEFLKVVSRGFFFSSTLAKLLIDTEYSMTTAFLNVSILCLYGMKLLL